jgi:ferritin
MIGKKVLDAINDQLNFEQHSAQVYLAMAADAALLGLNGVGNWFKAQAAEETSHAMKFFGYVLERGGRVDLKAIGGPDKKFDSVAAMFEAALTHERKVTKRILDLQELAQKEKDPATVIFLNWFITEQVEEEANVEDILAKLKLAGDKGGALLMLDKVLGERK